jgi:hypothetical protein
LALPLPNNRHLFLTVLESAKSKTKVAADSVIDKKALSSLTDGGCYLVGPRDGGGAGSRVYEDGREEGEIWISCLFF